MKRAGPADYEQLAERCVEIASECSSPTVAEAFRTLALDYLTRAARLRRRGSIASRAPYDKKTITSATTSRGHASEREGASAWAQLSEKDLGRRRAYAPFGGCLPPGSSLTVWRRKH